MPGSIPSNADIEAALAPRRYVPYSARQTGFMAGLEEIVAGSGPSEKPSFLREGAVEQAAGGGGVVGLRDDSNREG